MSASYYETCKSCKHVFKPKKMNQKLLLKRELCLCDCHWGLTNTGITEDEARKLISTKNKESD